ncbi:hypothetical protein GEOBRER4_n1756 [Citrifermentans bremense]|uniref:Uncharacterized protein n=1 Tax=Citrifermentans bremense TaxID=60035 RepID=A0A6S6M074_9BACT|nr:hypothetical protein [Citrifermentans bremense]BCG46939.1 hypothetical protein GEOBRER4_n1756 [Citrifermentans bremense]
MQRGDGGSDEDVNADGTYRNRAPHELADKLKQLKRLDMELENRKP